MLHQDAITVHLGLEGMVVIDVAERPDRIDIATAHAREVAGCPL